MTEQDLRIRFERMMLSLAIKPDLRRNNSAPGLYYNMAVQGRWIGYKAAYVEFVAPLV